MEGGAGELVLPTEGHFLQVTSCLATAPCTPPVPEHTAGAPVPVCCLPGPAPAYSRHLPLLFKVAFMDKEEAVVRLRELVHTGLSAAQLPAAAAVCPLQPEPPCWGRPSTESMQAVILG